MVMNGLRSDGFDVCTAILNKTGCSVSTDGGLFGLLGTQSIGNRVGSTMFLSISSTVLQAASMVLVTERCAAWDPGSVCVAMEMNSLAGSVRRGSTALWWRAPPSVESASRENAGMLSLGRLKS